MVESSTGNFGPEPRRTTNFYYDDAAHPADRTRVVDALGKTTSTAFDNFGDVTSVTDPLGGVTGYGYDTGRGWVTSTVDANNHTTRYDHDDHGRTTKTTDPLNHASATAFDADGRKVSTTDANNRTVTVSYDPAVAYESRTTRFDRGAEMLTARFQVGVFDVTEVAMADSGSFAIEASFGVRFEAMPACSGPVEAWRLFVKGDLDAHYVYPESSEYDGYPDGDWPVCE